MSHKMDARILNDSQIIDGYTVNFLIKKSQYNESYCVTNSSGASIPQPY